MKTLLSIIGVTMLLMSGLIGHLYDGQNQNVGSVNIGNDYLYTQITTAISTTTEVLGDNRGVLGSVIITEDQTGACVIYDATSTTAYAISQGTRVADFQSAQTEGVYTFDVMMKKGIILDCVNGYDFAGDWTITFRQY